MRERSEHILRITAPLKSLADRFAYAFLLAIALGFLLLGKANPQLISQFRMAVSDVSAPMLDALSRPAVTVSDMINEARELAELRVENGQLRTENERLLQWQATARKLMAENQQLSQLLGFKADGAAKSLTARVIGDSGGAFVRSLLINAGNRDGVRKGQVAVDGSGLLGRVAEVGERSARVLLVNDLNSRIPVAVESSRERAILQGDNSAKPKLVYLPITTKVKVGDRIVTSGHGGVFPAGLPVGTVTSVGDDNVRVTPFGQMVRIEFVRLLDFGLQGLIEDAAPRKRDRSTRRRRARR